MIQVFTKQIDSNIENKLMAIEGERMVGGVGINMQLYIKEIIFYRDLQYRSYSISQGTVFNIL